ncbi:MAG: hypothetical protein SGJ19_03280 [Planctomycetia bacterium]|nr:hypothetical protein [Planctomycetia bacterium]
MPFERGTLRVVEGLVVGAEVLFREPGPLLTGVLAPFPLMAGVCVGRATGVGMLNEGFALTGSTRSPRPGDGNNFTVPGQRRHCV